VKELL